MIPRLFLLRFHGVYHSFFAKYSCLSLTVGTEFYAYSYICTVNKMLSPAVSLAQTLEVEETTRLEIVESQLNPPTSTHTVKLTN